MAVRALAAKKQFKNEKERITHELKKCELLFDGYEKAAKQFLGWLEDTLRERK